MSTESPLSDDPEAFGDDDGVLYDEEVTPQHGFVGFTLRELLILGVWLVAFVVSFFPLYGNLSLSSVWVQGTAWIQAIGLPTVAVFLMVLRRFSPDGIRRVGSLGIDQFASVVFAFSALYWVTANTELVAASAGGDVVLVTWVTVVELVAALALVVLTVFAPLIPGLRDDFHGRLVTLAHRNANPVRPVIARPRPEKPTPTPEDTPVVDADLADEHTTDEVAQLGLGERVSSTSHASSGELRSDSGLAADIGLGTTVGADDSDYVPAYARSSRGQLDGGGEQDAVAAEIADEFEAAGEPELADQAAAEDRTEIIEDLDTTAPREVAVSAETTGAVPAASSQPFWALAPTERDVFDERGEPLFRIGPTAWALVVEDRGGAYVIRHDDGRIGYLHDIADITRG